MSNLITITTEIQAIIASTINLALLKRGFPSITISHNKNDRYPALDIKSEIFNTTPVFMKEIQIDNFGGSISNSSRDIIAVDYDGTKYIKEVSIVSIWIPVHVSYTHFSGGSNGTDLFSYHCELYMDGDRQVISTEEVR